MKNARLDETQVEIKIATININNLIYRWLHPNGRKWRGTEKTLDEGAKVEWKKLA